MPSRRCRTARLRRPSRASPPLPRAAVAAAQQLASRPTRASPRRAGRARPRPTPAAAAPPPARGGGGGGAATRLATQPVVAAASQPATATPNPKSFTEIVALFEARREARLVHHLMHHVHEVRCEPGLIEFRPEPKAPVDLAARLSGLLAQWKGGGWVGWVSPEPGKPPLVEQKAVQGDQLRSRAEADPLVQAILKTFPGAK